MWIIIFMHAMHKEYRFCIDSPLLYVSLHDQFWEKRITRITTDFLDIWFTH